jgi:hypothetical protein
MQETINNDGQAVLLALAQGTVHATYRGRMGCCCGCRGTHTSKPHVMKRLIADLVQHAQHVDGEHVKAMVLPGQFASIDLVESDRTLIAYLNERYAQ